MRTDGGEFTPTRVRIGTRGSALARSQTESVRDRLAASYPQLAFDVEVVVTRGDVNVSSPLARIGGKGLFTAELEAALLRRSLDAAVHSLKDLPTEDPSGLRIGAVPPRSNPADVIVSRKGYTLAALPPGAVIGTGSPRRAAQLYRFRRDLKIVDVRGNVDTRVRKALSEDGHFDAVILAYAGLERLGLLDSVTEILDFDVMLPSPGQAALGIQCRDEEAFLDLVRAINDPETERAVTAERSFLSGLGGGCGIPICALGSVDGGRLRLKGRVLSEDGSNCIDVEDETLTNSLEGAKDLGRRVAAAALANGAGGILGVVL
jgi:hydroxymethylbilane synthase